MASVEHCLYCFEVLSANLEKRTPMTLYQVQASWASYHKGLEDDDDVTLPEPDDTIATVSPSPSPPSGSSKSKLRIPVLQRLGRSSSSNSTPSTSTSSSSLAADTAATTPESSTRAFSPVGLHPRRTSQRSNTISSSPLFVTWNTIDSSSSRSLRGCIGTFESQPLSSGLSSYALISSLQDHRFRPITLAELPRLEVCVTLLTDFEQATDALDWELGVHGLRISFYARNKRFGGCYLPDVPVEQGWDKEETVVSLMRKAGWNGRAEKWKDVSDFNTVRFQGKAESLGFAEFKRWRDWVRKGEGEAKQ
ncbi:hypothetical protein LZ554_003943 [Drepanopeziza brunnea f. sp. 'monogermtubi']|nr:hypothetical protein LZ554_003943 [Drepanopeziza brunnea f. sp. 'monogermtubi']